MVFRSKLELFNDLNSISIMIRSCYFICFVLMAYCLMVNSVSAKPKQSVPLPVAILLNQINKLMSQDKLDDAIVQLEAHQNRGLKLKKGSRRYRQQGFNHYLVNFALGNCYLNQGQVKKAMNKYQQVTQQNPEYFGAWINLAKTEYELKHFLGSAKAFLKAYETMHEKDPTFLFYASAAFMSGEDPQNAYNSFVRLLELHRDSVKTEWQETLVSILFSLNRPKEALPYIIKITEQTTGEKRKKWQEILLYQYISLEMDKEAMEYVEFLVSDDPLDPKWWKGLAQLKLRDNRYDETLVALTIYSKLKTPTQQEKLLMASLCLSLDIPIQSSRVLEAIADQEIKPKIIQGLVQSYQRLYQPQYVLKWINVGLTHFEDAHLRMIKGNLLFEMQKYADAAVEFQTILDKNKNSGQAWLMRGYVAWKQNHTEIARLSLEQAAKYPNQKQAALNVLKYLNNRPIQIQ